MSDQATENAPIEAWRDNDILVASAQSAFVTDLLADAGVGDVEVEIDAGLDLARIRVGDPRRAGAVMTRRAPADPLASTEPAGTGDPLDRVLAAVRRISADRYGGWEPQVGKNRVVDRVGGVNGIVIHSDGVDPQTTDATLPPRAPGRGRAVTVGMIDGPLADHPWFEGAVEYGYVDAVPSGLPGVAAGHATFVAGLVLQEAPSASVRARAVLSPDGTADMWTAAKAIVALGNSGIDVLNLSFGCFTDDGRPPMALRQAVMRVDPRVVIVAAAGNHVGDASLKNRPFWPAALGRVVAVGAVARINGALSRAPFSPALPWVDVEAVGVDTFSTYLETAQLADGKTADFDGRARWQGTSFAAAAVSGMIAAGTVPGRVSAQQACADLMRALQAGGQPRGTRLCRATAGGSGG